MDQISFSKLAPDLLWNLAFAMLVPGGERKPTFMNASNLFQLPPCLQQADLLQRRRARFKRSMIVAVAVIMLTITCVLIEGCQNERMAYASASIPGGTAPRGLPAQADLADKASVRPRPDGSDVSNAEKRPVLKANTVADTTHPVLVYMVKSGDTLIRIARNHRTTVAAVKRANGLTSNRIIVGERLTIPAT